VHADRLDNLAQAVGYAWRQVDVPVIAALHGVCLGGGLQIALGADHRIATPSCKLSVLEAKWGLIPDMSGSITLREVVPIDVAKRCSWTAEMLTGTEAHACGLVTELSDDPEERALQLAAEMAEDASQRTPAERKRELLGSRLNRFHSGPRTDTAIDTTITTTSPADAPPSTPLATTPFDPILGTAFPLLVLPGQGGLPHSLPGTCRELALDSKVRGVVIRTTSAGGDVGSERTSDAAVVADCFRSLPVPVIAIVDGPCDSQTSEALLGADIRFGGPTASFSLGAAKSSPVESRARELGGNAAAEAVTSRGVISNADALGLGLLTPTADADASVRALATMIATRSPDSVAASKALFHRTWHASEKASLLEETLLQIDLLLSYNQIAASVRSLRVPVLSQIMRYRRRAYSWLKPSR
jgi:enoyl-CoA hydratase/carnithine racemase